MSTSDRLLFYVNGKKVIEENADPEWTLLHYLRRKLNLCGTKLGCGEGGCGACTVMISRYCRNTKNIHHYSVNACLTPVCAMHGLSVTTIEGIGNVKEKLHPVQERLALSHGSQCGFCTPGIVMSMYSLLRSNANPSTEDLEVTFQGNLCRCTGYRPIVDAYGSFVKDYDQNAVHDIESLPRKCAKGENCCKNKNQSENCNGIKEITENLVTKLKFEAYDASTELEFPTDLKANDKLDAESLKFIGKRSTWYRPLDLDTLINLKHEYPNAKLVVGNTEVGLEMKVKNYPVLIQANMIPELKNITKIPGEGIKFGASTTLTDLEDYLKKEVECEDENKTRIFTSIIEMLNWFAGKQIRNVGCIGGNIMTASPISDLNPIFLAAQCKVQVRSKTGGIRELIMDKNFFTSYRTTIIKSDEILLNILIPYSSENQYFIGYKQAKRREDDITIASGVFNVIIENNIVKDANFTFGGMAATTVVANESANAIISRQWNEELLTISLDNLVSELKLDFGTPGGVERYRQSLVLGFFFKFYIYICGKLNLSLDPRDVSATYNFKSKLPKGSQYYEIPGKQQENHDLVGRPLPHLSAKRQATGEAEYVDDIPTATNELYLALVTSTHAHAKIKNIDPTEALKLDGVIAFYSAKDVPQERNKRSDPIFDDEEVFASQKVNSCGDVIGAVVAESQSLAQRAVKFVKVDYEDLQPLVISIEDAIKHNSFYEYVGVNQIVNGNVEKSLSESKCKIEGEVKISGQEHFYLETQSVRVVPGKEDDEIEMFCSTQSPAALQRLTAVFLGIPANRVTSHVRRLGGAFGGKETKSYYAALPAALAAHRLKRPVRCMLDRDEDIVITAGRHPVLGKYKVGFTKEGVINAIDIDCFLNAGCSFDYSTAVGGSVLRAIGHPYKIKNIHSRVKLCKTNLPSNTALRAFGNPQGYLITESIIEDIANYLQVDPYLIRNVNLIDQGSQAYYGQIHENCTLRTCWNECEQKSNYLAKKETVEKFNGENRWKKRGISLNPTVYGCGFTLPFLHQGAALVNIYLDGSVMVTHGGVEMGQGLHTKMQQVASRALGIPEVDIYIPETNTKMIPNSIQTAASFSSDLYGMAVVDACTQLMERLKLIKEANPNGSWKEWVHQAYFGRINLSATGYFKTDGIEYDQVTGKGKPYVYYSYAAACSVVEIDCLTGDYKMISTDIVMDVGESINPAIDVGQIEGGFLQGVGLYTMEELLYSPKGEIITRGPSTYKIPGFTDVPETFNVSILRGSSNEHAVYSSKLIGEPPLLLAISVFCAIRNAVVAARLESKDFSRFRFDSPATVARIRQACNDEIMRKVPPIKQDENSKPWNIIV